MNKLTLLILSGCLPLFLSASVWIGGTKGVWSDAANWENGDIPNAPGASLIMTNRNAATITNDIDDGVTVGSIIRTETSTADQFVITSTKGAEKMLYFDCDGDGPGTAVVSNASPRRIQINGDARLTLLDDLLLINTADTTDTASISFTCSLGGDGHITTDNYLNTTNRAITLAQNNPTLTKGFLIRRGSTGTTGTTGLGASVNAVQLGATGYGDASLFLTGTGVTVPNPITVVGDSGGVLTIGACAGPTANLAVLSGDIVLEGDVHLFSIKVQAAYMRVRSAITGAGGIIKTGPGVVWLEPNNTVNTYEGTTRVQEGLLCVNNANGSGTGSGAVLVEDGGVLGGTGSISGNTTVQAGGLLSPGVDNATGSTAATLTFNNLILQENSGYLRDVGDLVQVNGTLTLPSRFKVKYSAVDESAEQVLFTAANFAGKTALNDWEIDDGTDVRKMGKIDGNRVLVVDYVFPATRLFVF